MPVMVNDTPTPKLLYANYMCIILIILKFHTTYLRSHRKDSGRHTRDVGPWAVQHLWLLLQLHAHVWCIHQVSSESGEWCKDASLRFLHRNDHSVGAELVDALLQLHSTGHTSLDPLLCGGVYGEYLSGALI